MTTCWHVWLYCRQVWPAVAAIDKLSPVLTKSCLMSLIVIICEKWSVKNKKLCVMNRILHDVTRYLSDMTRILQSVTSYCRMWPAVSRDKNELLIANSSLFLTKQLVSWIWPKIYQKWPAGYRLYQHVARCYQNIVRCDQVLPGVTSCCQDWKWVAICEQHYM